jgi:hypothetical protein
MADRRRRYATNSDNGELVACIMLAAVIVGLLGGFAAYFML